ncbi:hypothetical protein F0562_018980 [Nyssa sinensis]|uniref:NB-ARC domain-containing protein n=1 Tax=Nyssa sinensis TaxID=561372 RepID=A0A5J4ZC00_9ASTE|nr:hypothetical protein F0562_018980 [Nyssa sinensis]
MKHVNVLYLGRCQSSAKHHIEVGETKFLEGLKDMKHLEFLSLYGISQITKLSDSISKLANLKILDLRACHSLEVVPKGIKKIQSLTHDLDMSECYLLNHMPTELSSLTELQVLKGYEQGKLDLTNPEDEEKQDKEGELDTGTSAASQENQAVN